jgi:putative aldouronate transport system substrate-binding protein
MDSDYSQFPGLFQELNDLIARNAPNITKMFAEKPATKAISTQLDGKIYGLPKYQRYWPLTVTRQFVNKQWLDKLNLKVPTNWDELYNVLVAFKTKDPNGNGKADEIPMDWAPGMGFFHGLSLLGSQGITQTFGANGGWYVDNGKVANFFVDTRYREVVRFLNKCFAAGLINPEVFTQDYTKFQAVTRNPDAPVVGFTWGWDLTDRFGPQWAPQYITTAPLKPTASYAGKVTWDYSYDGLNFGANMMEMSSRANDKDVLMRFMDQFYDPVVGIQVLFGSIGPNIKDNGDGTYAVLPPQDAKMDPGTWKWTSTFADAGPMYISDTLKLTLGADMQALQRQDEVVDPYLRAIDPKKDVWPGVFLKFNADDNNTMARLQADLDNLTTSKFANWVANGGIEAEWDPYVRDADRAGLQQALQIRQKYYSDYMKM